MIKHVLVVRNISSSRPSEECDLCAWLIEKSRNLSTTWYVFTPSGQRGKSYEKYSFRSDFHISPDRHICAGITPCCCIISVKTDCEWGPCWLIDLQSKSFLKLLNCSWKIQNDVHIDTYYDKPELNISWRSINKAISNAHFLSATDQKCADSWTFW